MIEIIKIIACSLLVACLLKDFFYFQIDNVLVAMLAATGLIYQGLAYPPETWGWTLLIIMSLFLIGWALFSLGAMGGGDGKLLAALGFWIPGDEVGGFLVLITFIGAFVAVLELVGARGLSKLRAHVSAQVYKVPLSRWQQPIPYGIAIALAGLWFVGCQ
jgi:prepilin peptidase CpaA